uniref:Uncharacterized protein n=1 Tax=Anguilla anguilla TaxID=7936 RepID=A0A0E9W5M7_ANGAN
MPTPHSSANFRPVSKSTNRPHYVQRRERVAASIRSKMCTPSGRCVIDSLTSQ